MQTVYTLQSAFDAIWTNFIVDKRAISVAVNVRPGQYCTCLYVPSDHEVHQSRGCAIGCLIDDPQLRKYIRDWEQNELHQPHVDTSVWHLCANFGDVQRALEAIPTECLNALQAIHDSCAMAKYPLRELRAQLTAFAREHKLSIPQE
jgi:hypothetical protein